ncbi:30S ribosomal protein S20 [Chloroflexota bacterium]
MTVQVNKSAQKQTRVARRRQQRNKSVRSEVKTNITKAEKLVFAGELDAAREAVGTAVASLDNAAEKGIIHGNNAARRKSRLVKKLNGVVAASVAEPEPVPETEPDKTE